MKARSKLLSLVVALATAVGLHAADPKPAMVVQVVATEDAEAYATKLIKGNEIIKAKAGHEKLRRVFVGDAAGEYTQSVFVVSILPSAAAGAQLQEKLAHDAESVAFLSELKAIRKLGPQYLYKSVRNEGLYEGGACFNTSINCSDEDGYAKALDGLRTIFDSAGFKDAKLNLWRAASGRAESTHLVVISLPNRTRVAELIDLINDQNLLKDWNVAAAKLRTTVRNGTYHEITK